jgi:phosphoglucomutase
MAGKEGAGKIQKIVDYFRRSMPMTWDEKKIKVIEDYQLGKRNVVGEGAEDITLPKSNVIKAYLEDKTWFCIRPSGTEPKIKIYFSVRGNSKKEAKESLDQMVKEIKDKVDGIMA